MTETKSPNVNNFSFVTAEHDVLGFWQQNKIFELSLTQTASSKVFSFYDGPPFATGLPHHGHLLASTIKDIIPRYFTMNGYHVTRRFGWDCHGLPIEHEIDKAFGQSTDEIIKEKGISGYNDACRSIVQRYVKQWRGTITRLGRWVDFDNDYKTMNTDFMESIWWTFKQIWDKGLIYHGTKVVPFSTALGTVLSNFEAGSNYQDVQDPAITVALRLKNDSRHLLIWTTTPWTLPSNLGVCVNQDIEYVTIKDKSNDIEYILAKSRLEDVCQNKDIEIISSCKGSDLVGKQYSPLFNYFTELTDDGAFTVLGDSFVTTEDGTGIVHMAPAFGEDDHRVMSSTKIKEFPCPINNQGCFTDNITDYAGQYIKDADKQIIKDLKAKDLLYDHKTLVHSYPFCPRSDTPLIYRTIPSWYVSVEKIKQKLLANNEKITWVPEHIKHGRFGKWLDGARDWAISRNRVWGTPLPVWINDTTQKVHCIGSIEELEGLTNTKVTDLHRDHVDDLTFQLPNEEGTYRRISEVLDCWFESGAMPYASMHYPFENKELFESSFPANFIAEGLDQTRGWFYTLTILATILFDKPAFKNVIVNGIVMAQDGKKMSKRLKNYTAPDELMEKYGADALRLYLINSGLVKGEEQRFTDDGVKEMVRRTLLPWHNAFKFLHTYAAIDAWDPAQHQQQPTHHLDLWITSRMQSLKTMIEQHMKSYKLYSVVPELLLFIEDLTNTYIRLNRSRFWSEGLNDDKCQAYSTLYKIIYEFSVCMAPFAPFLSETIYQELLKLHTDKSTQPISVHLCKYPLPDTDKIDKDLEQAVIRLQHILVLGRQKRNDLKIKIKTPLKTLTVIHKDENLLNEIKLIEDTIKKELNIKNIEYDTQEDNYITLYAKPNSPVLGKRFGKRFGNFSKLIANLDSQQINKLEQDDLMILDNETFNASDILVFRESKQGSDAVTDRFITITLDSKLDQDLIQEGMAREIVNRIQKTRKEKGFNVNDRITIKYNTEETLHNIINKHKDYICEETLCLALEPDLKLKDSMSFDIDGEQLELLLEKH